MLNVRKLTTLLAVAIFSVIGIRYCEATVYASSNGWPDKITVDGDYCAGYYDDWIKDKNTDEDFETYTRYLITEAFYDHRIEYDDIRYETSNKNVIKIIEGGDDEDDYFFFNKPGKATVKIYLYDYGDPEAEDYVEVDESTYVPECHKITFTVKKSFFQALYYYMTSYNKYYYGDSIISGVSVPKAKLIATIKGRRYRATANSKGKFKIKGIKKYEKIGKNIKLTVIARGYKFKDSVKVLLYKPYMEHNYVYRNSTKIKGYVKLVTKGDILTIKIGSRTYTKKVPKTTKKFNYSIPISRSVEGTKIKISISNQYKQKLNSYSDVVYYGTKLKKGLTQKQVKLMPKWMSPDQINDYSGIKQWCYDRDGDGFHDAYLDFNSSGKLISWDLFGV